MDLLGMGPRVGAEAAFAQGGKMELRPLKAFLAVSDAGSFSRASIALSIAQPILSRQIKVLEEELGVDLFYRNGRGVVLTEAGRLLLAHAEVAVKTFSRAT